MEAIRTAIKTSRAYLCYECGKCTSNCPIARFAADYSPRRTVGRVLLGDEQDLIRDHQLWSCLTCGTCRVYCPSDVRYIDFIREMRGVAQECGLQAWCSHAGILQSFMKMMTAPDLKQNRLDWVTDDLKIVEEGEYLYFVGCLPYFQVLFSEIGVQSLEIARSTVRILNALDIQPVVMNNERCCGHDLLWAGDEENFKKLAERNLEEMKKTGARTVIMSCSECVRTFRLDYAELFGKLGFQVLHLSELLAQKIADGELEFQRLDRVVTYQDPCRLGRHLGVYEEPRKVMASIPGLELREMTKNRKNAVCCGTSAWMHCDACSKQIQIDRLKSARSTGADVLITTCPKCAIHFRCALSGNGVVEEGAKIEIEDLGVLVAQAMAGPKGENLSPQ